MFNEDFYPTSQSVIERMVSNADINGKTVLEPSAGKGDIVDYCIGSGAAVIACEKHEDLHTIVAKKCKTLAFDFLTVTSEQVSHVDFIIMNPPFTADEKHILHAWNIAPAGCHIIALCNWNTLDNRYSHSRNELNKIIEGFGNKEYIGDCFATAERKTNVEVGLVNLYKPAPMRMNFKDFLWMKKQHCTESMLTNE